MSTLFSFVSENDLANFNALNFSSSSLVLFLLALKAEKRVTVEDSEVADKVYQLDHLLTEFFSK